MGARLGWAALAAAVAGGAMLGFLAVGQGDRAIVPGPAAPAPAPVRAHNDTRPYFSDTGGAPAAPVSRGREIDALVATGKPEHALKAFEIAFECKLAREFERDTSLPRGDPDIDKWCAGVTQLHMMEMGKHLQAAVRASVKGAVTAQLHFGPLGGDLHAMDMRPNDPAVLEWQGNMRNALADEAKRSGDDEALLLLSMSYRSGSLGEKNPELALGYKYAQVELRRSGKDAAARGYQAYGEGELADLSKGMTPEQIAAARERGKRLVAECCKK